MGRSQRKKTIFVTKARVPNVDDFCEDVKEIFKTRQFTNDGVYVKRLEKELVSFLSVSHLSLCSNGTLALILAIKAAGLSGKKVITTPFTYVATLSALLWENCIPVFADIEPDTLCISPKSIKEKITEDVSGVLAVHVYGNICNVGEIETICQQNNLTSIYDCAHGFGSKYMGKSLLEYGDFSVCSFHATKNFHTAEGGCVVSHDEAHHKIINLMRSFGHLGDNHLLSGINAKLSELHAALGLNLLPLIPEAIEDNKRCHNLYDQFLSFNFFKKISLRPLLDYNYAYYPVVFDSEELLLKVIDKLNQQQVFPRRYFYPSLNTLSYLPETSENQLCPVAESVAPRVLCLPQFADLAENDIKMICKTVNAVASMEN